MENLNKEWDGIRVRGFDEVTIYDAFMESAAFDKREESEKRPHNRVKPEQPFWLS